MGQTDNSIETGIGLGLDSFLTDGGTVAEHLNVVHFVYGHEEFDISIGVHIRCSDPADRLRWSVVGNRRQLIIPVVGVL